MSPGPVPNEIVRALAEAVGHALQSGARDHGLPAARDVAQVLGLDGLDRALTVCRPGDPDTERIVRRLSELCEKSLAETSLEPWITADAELGRLAVECGGVIEGEPGMPLEGTLSVGEALDDVALADDASRAVAQRVRLTPQVSAALRAAIDWLCESDAATRRVRLRTEDSALEVVCPRVHASGVAAAAKVVAAIGGNLGPAATTGRAASGAGSGPWLIRVPIASPRATYLMVAQDGLDLALPWHAVLRVCMTPRAAFDSSIRTLGLPVLAPIVPLSSFAAEYPVVLVAHGLKRAYFVADRLIWRLPAEPATAPSDPRAPGFDRVVRTEDDTLYRVADPARLLETVAPIQVVDLDRTRAHPETAEPVASDAASTTPAPSGASARSTALVEAAADLAPETRDAGAAEVAELPELEPARVMPLALRALVAEDSISARHALVRLLEEQEMDVEAVGTAAELEAALARGPWALVCVDAELPDARGVELLRTVRLRALEVSPEAEIVALVRDRADETAALQAEIVSTLHKPWGRAAVTRLLATLGLAKEDV